MRTPIGLTGGIATGKSFTAELFRSLGANVVSGDAIAHQVLSGNLQAVKKLVECFGPEIQHSDGSLNRTEMLNKLIAHPAWMWKQIEILAPYILPAIDHRARYYMDHHPGSLTIVEAPLLFEYARVERYAPVIVVYAPRNIQIQRLMARSGFTFEKARRVVDLQIDIEKKRKMADFVVDNSGSRTDTEEQVRILYKKLIALVHSQ